MPTAPYLAKTIIYCLDYCEGTKEWAGGSNMEEEVLG